MELLRGITVKFMSDDVPVYFWTSTIGRAPQDFWVTFYPNQPTSYDAGTHHGPFQALCARTMEPDLLAALAKAAHPPTPVANLVALKSVPSLVQGEDAMVNGQFQDAVDSIKQGLAIDPQSTRGLHDLALAQSHLGQWSDAVTTMQEALKIDKNFVPNDLKVLQGFQKQSLKDTNVTNRMEPCFESQHGVEREAFSGRCRRRDASQQARAKVVSGILGTRGCR